MGPAARKLGSPVGGPSAVPDVRVSETSNAPEAPLPRPWKTRTLRRSELLGDAALFAASGVKRGVKGEGGATPSIARDLDPAPWGAGRPAGVAPPSSTAKNRIAQWHGPRSARDPVAITTVPCCGPKESRVPLIKPRAGFYVGAKLCRQQ